MGWKNSLKNYSSYFQEKVSYKYCYTIEEFFHRKIIAAWGVRPRRRQPGMVCRTVDVIVARGSNVRLTRYHEVGGAPDHVGFLLNNRCWWVHSLLLLASAAARPTTASARVVKVWPENGRGGSPGMRRMP